ncbi:MAG: hypothetical protein VB081_14280 [Christensenella sp.]|uniref:hypothetical protein n=1 Tax=Christensenella sp. TaxID=1935934 RepID=UPI002B2067D9|nr:hypothetical protein [Christensenella sp.]MEA5004651.1 hypothetical protein [Christensenella sp.]
MNGNRELRSKIKLVFASRKKGYPGWPHIDFDHEGLAQRYLEVLQKELPNCDFTVALYNNAEEANEGYKDNGQYDGVVLFNSSHGVGVVNAFLQRNEPGVIIDELYAGSGDLVRFNTLINKKKLPVVVVASSDFADTVRAIKLLHVRKQLKESKMVVFKNFEPISADKEAFLKEALGTGSTWQRYEAGEAGLKGKIDSLKKTFGVDVVIKTKRDLEQYIAGVDDEAARKVAKGWVTCSQGVIEPSDEEIFESAKMYLALSQAVREEQADAVSVDCIMMFYTTEMSSYPCMSHSTMLDMGITAVCEGDFDSTLTQLVMRYITDRAGFVSDPVIDTARNQIIYAHCAAATKWYGDDSARQPYFLRTHSEDHNSTSIQTIMPVGDVVTTVKYDIESNAMAIHTGMAVGNVTEEKGCRTKLAVEVPDAQLLLDNWDADVFSWHKVTCYGDYRTDFMNFAKLYGSKVIQEDKDIPVF